MKSIRILFLAACMPFFAACSDDDDIRLDTTNPTVEFEASSAQVKETTTFINIPVVVSGNNRDGDVLIQVSLKEVSEGLKLNESVILTTENLRIPAEKSSMNVEISLLAENVEVETGRYFKLSITDARGGDIGTKSEYTVYLTEKNYIEGTYLIRGLNPFDGVMASGQANITAEDETLDKVTIDFGLGGAAKMTFRELLPDRLYSVSIEPFALMGIYNGSNVYLSQLKVDEDTAKMEYSRENPITGRYEKIVEDGETIYRFTFTDGFGLMSLDSEDKASWYQYDTFREEATMTKEE